MPASCPITAARRGSPATGGSRAGMGNRGATLGREATDSPAAAGSHGATAGLRATADPAATDAGMVKSSREAADATQDSALGAKGAPARG